MGGKDKVRLAIFFLVFKKATFHLMSMGKACMVSRVTVDNRFVFTPLGGLYTVYREKG